MQEGNLIDNSEFTLPDQLNLYSRIKVEEDQGKRKVFLRPFFYMEQEYIRAMIKVFSMLASERTYRDWEISTPGKG